MDKNFIEIVLWYLESIRNLKMTFKKYLEIIENIFRKFQNPEISSLFGILGVDITLPIIISGETCDTTTLFRVLIGHWYT